MNLITTIHDGSRIMNLQSMTISPLNLSIHAQRGFDRAEYSISGQTDDLFDLLGYLNYVIKTTDQNGNLVWAGYINEATVTTKGFTVGFNLTQMYNRVRVKYSFTNLNGENEDAVTTWVEHADSIARFGIKEKVITMSDTKLTAAEAKRDTFLAEHANPIPIITFETSDVALATIVAVGAWNLLDWNYYENPLGREVYENSFNTPMAIGWQISGTELGFQYNRLYDHALRLKYMPDGARFLVTGSRFNNTWFTKTSPTENDDLVSVTSTHFTFDPEDDIRLTDQLFVFPDESMIKVVGSELNDGYYYVKTPGDSDIEVSGGPHAIRLEDSGRSITLEMGNRIQLSEDIQREMPENLITVTIPSFRIAQPFRLTTTTGWSVKEISCQVYRVGTPTDQMRFSIYSDNAGLPGAPICTALLTTAEVPYVPTWQSAILTNSFFLSAATTYWVVVDRTGSVDYQNYFMVNLGDDPLLSSAPGLDIRLFNGTHWVEENVAEGDTKHCMGFQLWGVADSLTILKSMLDANRWFSNVYIPLNSGVEDYIYKNGEESVLAEADKIMQAGTATGKRLLIRVSGVDDITIHAESVPQMASSIFYDTNGTRKRGNGALLEKTTTVAGEWVYIVGDNIPFTRAAYPLFPVLIQESTFDAGSGTVRITPWAMEEEDI